MPPIVVCGAGAAGLAAALSAARAGRSVRLVEQRSEVGGTLAGALLHTLAGHFDSNGNELNGGLSHELLERLRAADASVKPRRMGRVWVESVDPNLYRDVARAWVDSEPRISLELETQVIGAVSRGARVVELELMTPRGPERAPVSAAVDTSGRCALLRAVDPALHVEEDELAAGGFIFRVRGVTPGALGFPRGLAVVRELREAARTGRLPPECDKAWLDVGIFPDEAFVKLFVPLEPHWQAREEDIVQSALATRQAVLDFLREQDGFRDATLSQTGLLGVRDGGRMRGRYCLTKDDVLALRKFDDAACRCAWPIEYWDARHGVKLEYLEDAGYYEIPLRCLQADGFENLWAAGMILSADRHARASARCVGTCWAMGDAAGRAAAQLAA